MDKIRTSCSNCKEMIITFNTLAMYYLCHECKAKEKQDLATFLAKNKLTS